VVRRGTVAPKRLVALLIVIAVAFAGITARLAYVQGMSATRYAVFGEAQRLRTIKLSADRGSILDRTGAALAISTPQRTVWADPRLVTDPAAEARALSPVLGLEEGVLRERLAAAGAFVYLARKVDDSVADRVEAMHLPGLSVLQEPKRFDPSGPLALPLLGQLGIDNQGLSGLEQQYEGVLAGHPGRLMVERDPSGHRIPSGVHQLQPSRRGNDLVLTIDRSMQYETERALSEEIVASNAKGGIAIVMEPTTGEILAMANLARDGESVVPASSNSAVTRVYEPGSVNKVITVAAALEEGLASPSTRLLVPDHMTVADGDFGDAEPHPTQQWTVTDILANSSNVGSIMLAQRLGRARVDKYLRDFGLGRRSGLQFPGESVGLVPNLSDWSGTSIATLPIGQGVAVTALQMLAAVNTIADGGVRVSPKLVKAVVGRKGNTENTPPSERRTVVSPATARLMTGMLSEVVRSGTAKAAAVEGYTVAGKTGTARKPLEGARGYKEGAYVATFAGFVPAEDPRLSAIVVLDEPTPIYGGLVSAPVFSELAQYGLRLLRVPPPAPIVPGEVPDLSPDAARTDREGPARAAPAPPSTLGGARSSPPGVPAVARP
jgi:cell division protein FtsI (penicillin-binding protein 3)